MKLYFYFFKTYKENGENKAKIEEEVCEVGKETPLRYYPKGRFPRIWKSYLEKGYIGKLNTECYENFVAFTEPNFETAKKIFTDYISDKVCSSKNKIESLKDEIFNYEKYISDLESEG